MPGFLKSFLSTTSLVVWITMFLTAGLVVAQYFFPTVLLPQLTAAWILTVVAGGYAGTDRIAYFYKNKEMPSGTLDMGDTVKLRTVVFMTLFVFLIAAVFQFVFKVQGLALEQLLIAYGGAAATYVMGNKVVQAAGSMSGKSLTATGKPTETPITLPEDSQAEVNKVVSNVTGK